MCRILFLVVPFFLACSQDQSPPFSSAGKATTDGLVAVASDSLYCKDAALWRAYCKRWDMPDGGCEAIASCREGETLAIAPIESDTAWVEADPSDFGWIRMPQASASRLKQRWTHPEYAWWFSDDKYRSPSSPDEIGLVPYKFRSNNLKRTDYGFPCDCDITGTFTSPAAPTPDPLPEVPAEPSVPVPEDVFDVRGYELYIGENLQFHLNISERGNVHVTTPSWLTFDKSTGLIEGVPTERGRYEILVIFLDEDFAERYFVDVEDTLLVNITYWHVGEVWWTQYQNPSEIVSVTGLPSWLSYDKGKGRIEGTPPATGRYEFVVHKSDGIKQPYLLIIEAEASDRATSSYSVGQSFTHFPWVPDYGTPPLTFTIEGALPPGVSLELREDGPAISGTAEEAGTFDFDFVVVDATGDEIHREKMRLSILDL